MYQPKFNFLWIDLFVKMTVYFLSKKKRQRSYVTFQSHSKRIPTHKEKDRST
ncbi:hypothetical protein BD560DRAFT_401624 [Blakeslea trispora]|nr:hypothetical protein BD560DRAFT_401624 [Blakeslea trispora]